MAERTNVGSRDSIASDSPKQIAKDIQSSDNALPLSPQWLLPKPGDCKPVTAMGDSYLGSHASSMNRLDTLKAPGSTDDYRDSEKKRDVFRPSLLGAEAIRRDRWRDEERDTSSGIRRDRWKGEGEKEFGGDTTRKMDRWSENPITRSAGEARRSVPDRWADSGNRETGYEQRRESKWNTRWGPEDKESESWREKWLDSGKDGEGARDKVLAPLSHGKDIDREADHFSRSWRSNVSQNRGGRGGDTPHHHSLTPNKQPPLFNYGRGRGENVISTFSAGRGRINSNNITAGHQSSTHPHSFGVSLDKTEGSCGDSSTCKYSRTKLIDVYRKAVSGSDKKPLDGFVEVPSLTQEDPLEPLALSAPSPEEVVILRGIDKGDIVGSGSPQISKEGSVGRNSTDMRRARFGSGEDLSFVVDDGKGEVFNFGKGDPVGQSLLSEKHVPSQGPDLNTEVVHSQQFYQDSKQNIEGLRTNRTPYPKLDEIAMSREAGMQERFFSHSGTAWRPQSMVERSLGHSHDWRDFSTEFRVKTADVEWENVNTVSSAYYKDKPNFHVSEGGNVDGGQDFNIKKQLSGADAAKEVNVFLGQDDSFIARDRSAISRKDLALPSPEDLLYYYKDPQGEIQGPFSGNDLIGWFEAGYFGIDLPVRVATASSETPFSLLGDAIPQLRTKTRPPPGFSVPKQSDNVFDASNRGKFGGLGEVSGVSSDYDLMKNEHRNRHELMIGAENRLLESLMSSGSTSTSALDAFAFGEGKQSHVANSSAGLPSVKAESGTDLNFLLAQRLSLERQRSLPNPVPYWPGRDASSVLPKAENVPDPLSPHSKLLPSLAESRQISLPQNADLRPMLQTVLDKSAHAMNPGLPAWANLSDVRSLANALQGGTNPIKSGGMDIIQDKLDMRHHNQPFASPTEYGVLHQMLPQQPQQQQFPPSVSVHHILSQQPIDHPSGMMAPEKLPSSNISQDPQVLSLLQQQYLLSQYQLHPQAPLPSQLSLLDKLLLLKQQQKQEQQQQLLFHHQQQQHQQHLLSQVLGQSHSHFGEPLYGTSGNAASSDHLRIDESLQPFHSTPQIPSTHLSENRMPDSSSDIKDDQGSSLGHLAPQVPQDVTTTVASDGSSVPMPHQLFDGPIIPKGQDVPLSSKTDNHQESLSTMAMADWSSLPEVVNMSRLTEALDAEHRAVVSDVIEPAILEASQHAVEGYGHCLSKAIVDEASKIPVSLPSVDAANFQKPGKADNTNIKYINEEPQAKKERSQAELHMVKEEKIVEVKKASEKKSRKGKNPKTLDQAKGLSKTNPPEKLKFQDGTDGMSVIGLKAENSVQSIETLGSSSVQNANSLDDISTLETAVQQGQVSSLLSKDNTVPISGGESNLELEELGPLSENNLQPSSSQRAWKAAPGFKPKSLLEIQQEEQRKALAEQTCLDIPPSVKPSSFSVSPWSGVVGNPEQKTTKESHQDVGNSVSLETTNLKSRKSQLHDLLAEEVLAKANERTTEASSMPLVPAQTSEVEASAPDDNDFVEAKDSKKSRKKAAKSKNMGRKICCSPGGSVDLPVGPSNVEKSKSSRQVPQEQESLPPTPSGPSLGDFVLWKGGDQKNSTPAPAWSKDMGKLPKPTSLREIQKEEEKKIQSVQSQLPLPIATPAAKAQSNRSTRGSSSFWLSSGSSPSKTAASPVQMPSQSKSKLDDDLFWGPLDQPKEDIKRTDFPSLSNTNNWGSRATPTKVTYGGASLSRQKSSGGGRQIEYSLSSSPASAQALSKGKQDVANKQSEAMDFRDWCESESLRLTGMKDTSVLQFCLKLPTSEARMLLIENLGTFDPNHEFIDNFLNYKELLPADVLDIAFQARNERRISGIGADSVHTNSKGDVECDSESYPDGPAKGGGKKKGKKGKKVNPSVLGFNVVSNRIMMGEIQTIEE